MRWVFKRKNLERKINLEEFKVSIVETSEGTRGGGLGLIVVEVSKQGCGEQNERRHVERDRHKRRTRQQTETGI